MGSVLTGPSRKKVEGLEAVVAGCFFFFIFLPVQGGARGTAGGTIRGRVKAKFSQSRLEPSQFLSPFTNSLSSRHG